MLFFLKAYRVDRLVKDEAEYSHRCGTPVFVVKPAGEVGRLINGEFTDDVLERRAFLDLLEQFHLLIWLLHVHDSTS